VNYSVQVEEVDISLTVAWQLLADVPWCHFRISTVLLSIGETCCTSENIYWYILYWQEDSFVHVRSVSIDVNCVQ